MELGLYRTESIRVATLAITTPLSIAVARPIDVLRFGITFGANATANGVISLKRRNLVSGSLSAAIVTATLTSFATNGLAGQMFFSDVGPNPTVSLVRFNPGEEIVLDITTSFGAVAGTVWYDFQARHMHKRDVSSAYYARLVDANPTYASPTGT